MSSSYNISVNLQTRNINVNLAKQAISLNRNDYVKPVRGQFVVGDLDGNNDLIIPHNLNIVAESVMAVVFDANGEAVTTQYITVDKDTAKINIGGFASLMGADTWKYLLIG